MSDLETNLLRLPFLGAAQAQKHVTHNEALRQLDVIVHLAVIDTTHAEPPASPEEGDRYIVGAGADGAWAGREACVASFTDGAWMFATPQEGWRAFDRTGEAMLIFVGGEWRMPELPYDNGVSGLAATSVQDAIDEIAAGGGGGGGAVASVFGRTGAVAAASGDYDASQVANDSGVSGASVKDALDALASGKQVADADLAAIAALSPANDDVIQRKAGAWTSRSMAQVKVDLALARGDVGLGNVTNDAQLKAASNLADLGDAAVARTNLGLGSLATLSSLAARYLANSALGFSGAALINGTIAASVASGALTLAVKTLAGANPSAADPVYVCFRNATAATGDFTVLTLSAATSLVISSGSTVGAVSGTPFRLWIAGFNDDGTFRLGAIKCAAAGRIHPLQDDALASATAEGGSGSADSAGVIYAGLAVSSKPLRILGYAEWSAGLATAGTWASAPTKVQLFGPGICKPGEMVQSALGTTSTTVTHTNSGLTDTGLAATLTPTSAANAVKIAGTNTEIFPNASGLGAQIKLLRGSTAVLTMSSGTIGYGSNSLGIINVPFFWLDFPGTTSATTYKTQAAAGNASGTVNSQHNGGTSVILAEEIMA